MSGPILAYPWGDKWGLILQLTILYWRVIRLGIDVGRTGDFVDSRNENSFSKQCFDFESLQLW
jgi:hypothetical protein